MRRLPRRPASCARSTVAEAIKVLEDAGPLRAPEPGQKPDTSEGAATKTPPPNPRRSGGGAGCDLTADQAVSLDSNDPTSDPTNVRTSGPDRRGLRSTLCRRGLIPYRQSRGLIPSRQNRGPIPYRQSRGPIPYRQSRGPILYRQSRGPIPYRQSRGPKTLCRRKWSCYRLRHRPSRPRQPRALVRRDQGRPCPGSRRFSGRRPSRPPSSWRWPWRRAVERHARPTRPPAGRTRQEQAVKPKREDCECS